MNHKISLEEFTEDLKKKYTVSVEEAHALLYAKGITKSTNSKLVMGLLRDEVIDAILIGKGKVEDRKWLINEQSLLDFIAFKTMDFTTFTEMKRKVEKNRLLQEKLKEIKLLIQD